MFEHLKFTIQILKHKPVRTLLTVLQVSVGVAAVTLIINMLYQSNAVELTSLKEGLTLLTVANQEVIEMDNQKMYTMHPLFTPEDLDEVKKIPGLMAIPMTEHVIYDLVIQEGMRYVIQNPTGINADYLQVVDLPLVKGHTFSEPDFQNRNRVLLISEKMAQALFGEEDPIGQSVSFSTASIRRNIGPENKGSIEIVDFEVIGVYAKDDLHLPYILQPNHFLAPLGAFEMSSGNMGSVIIMTPELQRQFASFNIAILETNASHIKEEINSLLLMRHPDEQANIKFEEPHFGGAAGPNKSFTLFLGAFALVGMIVSSIGVLSIMMVSIIERTREFGLRRSLGASRGAVLRDVLIEAVILTLLGALVGVGVACIFSQPISILLADIGEVDPTISLKAIGISLLFSFGVGLISGLYPAILGSKLPIVEAIKEG